MPKRQFNGREIEWLMGHDEDNPYDGIVQETPLEGTDGGYQTKSVVAKHPDGKLYRFTYYYDTDHGMTLSDEDPDRVFEAVEVKAVPVTTYKYVPVKDQG